MVKNGILIVFFLILFILWIRYIERRSIFFPMKDFSYTPQTFNLEYEDIFFKTNDGFQINAWFIPSHSVKNQGLDKEKFTILFCHGNGGNISHRISKIAILHELGLNVFIYDFRGYGKSQGRPSESGIYLDAQAAYNYIVKEKGIYPDRIIVYGESLGGAVAVDLAAKVKLKALILEGVFSRAKDMAKEIYPFLPAFFIQSKFDSLTKIKNITIPKIFIHSLSDEIVPIELSKRLYNKASDPKFFLTIEGSHNLAFMDSQDKVKVAIKDFLDKL